METEEQTEDDQPRNSQLVLLASFTRRLSLLTSFCCAGPHRLKDSDVTWLYGPLHPGSDWEPLPKPVVPTRPVLAQTSTNGFYTKPILKHRSITEILSLPTAPYSDADQSPEPPASQEQQPSSSASPHPSRPFLPHTKSDTHILRARTPRDAFRKDSPPRTLSRESAECGLSVDESTSAGTSTGSEQDLLVHTPQPGKRKHISFNTFVQQCIAIESPRHKRPSTRFVDEVFEDDGSVPFSFPCPLFFDCTLPPPPCPSSCPLAAMIRIRKVTSIIPTSHDLPRLIIPPPTRWIPTLTRMTPWRCVRLLPGHGRHHLLALVHQRLPLFPIPLLQTEVRPFTKTITGQSPTSPPPS